MPVLYKMLSLERFFAYVSLEYMENFYSIKVKQFRTGLKFDSTKLNWIKWVSFINIVNKNWVPWIH